MNTTIDGIDIHAHGVPKQFLDEVKRTRLGGVDVVAADGGYVVTFPGCAPLRPAAGIMLDFTQRLGWLDAQDKAKPGPVGCVGYCMSGMHITNAAAFYPHRIKSAASLYGVGIITDKEDSPHLFLDRIKGELYYAFAETDRSVPPHIPGELKGLLEKHGIKHELKTFPGTEHGFAFPERAIYNTLAAEETWTKMFAMWDRTLK